MTARPTQLEAAKGIPILNVAGELGLKVEGRSAHCWRKENHTHGDNRPSLGFYIEKNKYKCFVCEPESRRSGSTIDLVMGVLRISLPDALKWFSAHFDIPQPGPRLPDFDHQKVTLSTIIRSGVWAGLTDSQRNILAVLWYLRDKIEGTVTVSYSSILRLSGLNSRKTFAAVIRFFEESKLIEVQRRNRAANIYRFIEHEDFLKLQLECKNLVPSKGTTSTQEDANLVPSKGTSYEPSSLVPSRELVPLAPCIKASVPSRGTSFEISEREQQVLKLAARGFQLFPCRPQSKVAAVRNWPKLATADPKKLAEWFAKFPDANWACATGRGSRVWVLDCDGQEAYTAISKRFQEYGCVPDTLIIVTGREMGRHFWFRYPADAEITNKTGLKNWHAGIDVRGCGGYVMVPPSIWMDDPEKAEAEGRELRPSRPYEFLNDDEDHAIAATPAWLSYMVREIQDWETPHFTAVESNATDFDFGWNEIAGRVQ